MIINVIVGGHQWSWESSFVPAPGDTLSLWVAEPGEEADDTITATVIGRRMYAPSGEPEPEGVELLVELNESVPDGWVADSSFFPSREWHERRREFEATLARIRNGGKAG